MLEYSPLPAKFGSCKDDLRRLTNKQCLAMGNYLKIEKWSPVGLVSGKESVPNKDLDQCLKVQR